MIPQNVNDVAAMVTGMFVARRVEHGRRRTLLSRLQTVSAGGGRDSLDRGGDDVVQSSQRRIHLAVLAISPPVGPGRAQRPHHRLTPAGLPENTAPIRPRVAREWASWR